MKPVRGDETRAAQEAAQWIVRLQTGDADAAQLAQWRIASPLHEHAWQRAERVMRSLGLVQGSPGAQALRRADRAGRRQTVQRLAMLLLAPPATLLAWQSAPWSAWRAGERTARGERRQLSLPDGGQLWLDSASAADLHYGETERIVALHAGGLRIETAVDPRGRPFSVHMPQGTALALGTRFSVRLFEAHAGRDAFSRVAVSQGVVLLSTRHGIARRLEAGWQVDATVDSASLPAAFDPAADAWVDGVLYADRMPLGLFVAELSRYRAGLLRCDPQIAPLQVSGAFQLDDTDAALRALALSLPVSIEQRSRYWVTVVPR